MRPLLIIVSAPSGAGKSTLCNRLLADRKNIVYSISCTTRRPRGEEVDGRNYYFLTDEQFDADVKAGMFLEHAVVHGNKYGTPKNKVTEAMHSGKSVVMDIDVQGARQLRGLVASLPEDDVLRAGYVDIFIAPPSIATLRERLVKRNEDTPAVIDKRIRNAEIEMAGKQDYKYLVVNDDLERAYAELRGIVDHETAS